LQIEDCSPEADSPLADKLKILKWKEKRGNFFRKVGSPTERLLDYGVEIEKTRQLSNIIAKLTITAFAIFNLQCCIHEVAFGEFVDTRVYRKNILQQCR